MSPRLAPNANILIEGHHIFLLCITKYIFYILGMTFYIKLCPCLTLLPRNFLCYSNTFDIMLSYVIFHYIQSNLQSFPG